MDMSKLHILIHSVHEDGTVSFSYNNNPKRNSNVFSFKKTTCM